MNLKKIRFTWILISSIVSLIGCDDASFLGLESRFNPGPLPTVAEEAEAGRDPGPTLTPIALPTLTPTAVPPTPTPTIDPTLPDWTVLVYMAADNSLDAASVFNINQMEQANLGDNIQVIVQWDRAAGKEWSDTRRYKITKDDDPATVNSTIVEEIGELNMGDPSVLADFVDWGLKSFPANRTALVVWDHGVGWSGIAEDETDGDQLTLDELERGLAAGIQNRSQFKFDMIGFDACLMGQLDVYQSLVPYAQAAAASEELTPAAGWPYTLWLNQLSAEPKSNGKQAATFATESFIKYYSTEAPSDFVTMAAIDLEEIEAVTEAVNGLTAEFEQDLTLAASIIAPARAGTEIYAKAYGLNAERFGAVDLNHFATILQSQSPNETIAQLAKGVSEAVDAAVMLSDSGRGLPHASGISIYFPNTAANLDPSYANETANPLWERFLDRYYSATVERSVAPEISIFQEPAGEDGFVTTAGQQIPLWLGFQVSGLGISGVNLLVGQAEATAEGGEQLMLLEVDPLIPEPQRLVDGSEIFEWQDGLHEDFFIWDTRVTWLQDDLGNGQFVILWATTPDGSGDKRTASGILTDGVSGLEQEASLVFDTNIRWSIQAWAFTNDGTPFEISAKPGDTFTPHEWVLTDAGLETRPGTALTLNGAAQLSYEWRPLPDGSYKVGFEAKNREGNNSQALVDITVNQSGATERTYLDPYSGLQFDYPADWYVPEWRNELLFTTDQAGDTALQVTIYDQSSGLAPEQIQAQALETFGGVDLLYQETLEIGGQPALETAYGYADGDGVEHTGLFYAFVNGDQGIVIDVDGLRENEAATIEIGRNLAGSWRYRPIGSGLFPGRWPKVDLERIAVPNPADFDRNDKGEWQRFSASWDPSVFIAFNSNAEPTRTAVEQVGALAASASKDSKAYEETTTFRIAINDRIWARRDFSYVNDSGQLIWGFLMVAERDEGEDQIMAWAEAPAASYNRLDQNVFVVMLTQIEEKNNGE